MKKSEVTGIHGTRIPNIKILGTATSFPKSGKWILNEEIHKLIYGQQWKKVMQTKNIDADYYRKMFGFQKRYWVCESNTSKNSLTTADLMEAAGKKILAKHKVHKDKISLLIAVSTTTHRYTTSLGAIVAGRLNLKCASFEIKAGCSSSVYALFIASQFVNSTKENVLILSGETLSKIASGPFLYSAGDGGAGVLLGYSKNTDAGISSYYLDSDGSYSDQMGVPGKLPPIKEAFTNNEYFFKSSKNLNSIIEEKWKKIPDILYKQSNIKSEQIKAFIPNQVNSKLIQVGLKAANLNRVKLVDRVKNIANCGQVSLLIALDYALKKKKLNEGDYFMLSAVGGGLGWGGLIWKL